MALVALAVLATAGTAAAASWHEMVHRTDRFLTDGHRYAAWADFASPSLSVLDTWTGVRRTVGKPIGCSLPTTFDDPSGTGALVYPGLVLWCPSEEPSSRLLDLRTGAVSPVPTDGAALTKRLTAADLCRSVSLAYRRALRQHLWAGAWFSISQSAMLSVENGAHMRLTRCGQRSVVVDHRSWGQTPRVGAGWASWDTGIDLSFYDGYPIHAPGTVEAVRLRDLARRTWRAPRLRVDACGALTPRWPVGRSDHTRTGVFWIATTAGEDQLTCDPSRARVFWTPLR